jgi:hypothetical protein
MPTPQPNDGLSSDNGPTISSDSAASSLDQNECVYLYVKDPEGSEWPGHWELQKCHCNDGFTQPSVPTKTGIVGEILKVPCKSLKSQA